MKNNQIRRVFEYYRRTKLADEEGFLYTMTTIPNISIKGEAMAAVDLGLRQRVAEHHGVKADMVVLKPVEDYGEQNEQKGKK